MSANLIASIFANEVVLIAILAVMLGFYAHAVYLGQPSVLLYNKNPSTASSFWFYFAAVFCLLLTYAVYNSAKIFSQEDALLVNLIIDILGDLAGLCTLATAWAYSRGKDFSAASTLVSLGLAAGFLIIWHLMWRTIAPPTLFFVLLRQAPGIVLAVVATVALGWVFFVRWGGLVGGIYLLIRVGYGVLQLPANLRAAVGPYFKDGGTSLDISFAWLAGGKVLLAIAFMSLLCRSDLSVIAISEPTYAPQGEVNLPEPVRKSLLLDLAIAFVMAIIAAPLIDYTCAHVPWCIWR
jgi:hypothetical protein